MSVATSVAAARSAVDDHDHDHAWRLIRGTSVLSSLVEYECDLCGIGWSL
jgi:hypothetical protein